MVSTTRKASTPLPVAVFDTEYSVVTWEEAISPALDVVHFGQFPRDPGKSSLGAFLTYQVGKFPGVDRILILSGEVLDGFNVPHSNPSPGDPRNAPTEHRILESIRDEGFTVKALTPYMKCRKTETRYGKDITTTLTVAVFDWLTHENTPMLMKGSPHMTCCRMNDWFERTEVQWNSRGSFTGIDLFWHVHNERRLKVAELNSKKPMHRRAPLPSFRNDIRDMLTPPEGMTGCESPYTKRKFFSPRLPILTDPRYAAFLTVDARKAYLSAASHAYISYEKLRPGPLVFDKGLSGYWRVSVAPWTNELLPRAAGYREPLADGTMWVTTPTLDLLEEIGHEFSVYESWVGPRVQGLKHWAQVLSNTLTGDRGPALESAVKSVAVQTIGEFGREGMKMRTAIYRPDWADTVRALFRSNLYRKMQAVADSSDVYPLWIETDKVFYPIGDEWGIRHAQMRKSGRQPFPEGTGFGEFRYDREELTYPLVADTTDPHEDAQTMTYSADDDFDGEA